MSTEQLTAEQRAAIEWLERASYGRRDFSIWLDDREHARRLLATTEAGRHYMAEHWDTPLAEEDWP